MSQTVFGDLRQRARAVYRITTRGSEYLLGIHELRGRHFVIVRGVPGTDREHVVARDSDPRIGEHSLFELPVAEWPGRVLEIATMTSSAIEAVVIESDPTAIAAVSVDGAIGERREAEAPRPASPWARPAPVSPPGGANVALPPPPGMSENPRIVPVASRGTHPGEMAAREGLARQLVVGQTPSPTAEPQVPYPQRHVGYAESVVQLLRSIANRDRLFDDVARDPGLRDRLHDSLDEAARLIATLRARVRR
jgi:hypothetical protein